MTGSSKLAIILGGFVVCFYAGWFIPLLWLLWLIGMFVLIAIPNNQKVQPPHVAHQVVQQPVSYTPVATQSVDTDVVSQLESMLELETNEDIKEGIRRSLAVIQSSEQNVLGTDQGYGYQALEPVPVPVMTEAQLAEHKKRQELRNINTILYTASFLLVGSAALFVGFSDLADSITRFMTILVVTILFYGSGLAIHAQSERLRPAAIAFVGTGLALIPFVGLAFNSFVVDDPSLSWWLTSIVGLVAFIVALSRIKTTPMMYLTLGFVFSVATSSVSMLDAPFVWYFVSIVFVGSILLYLGVKAPKLIPARLRLPLETSGQIAAPVALIGSVFALDALSTYDYALITGVGALHYLVNALGVATDKTRFPYWTAGRALTILSLATLSYAWMEDWKVTSIVLVLAGVASHVYSVSSLKKEAREYGWLWASQGLLFVALFGLSENMTHVSGVLLLVAGLSLHQLFATRRFELAIPGILAAMALPLVVLRGVLEPVADFSAVAVLTLCMAYAVFGIRWMIGSSSKSFVGAASALYVALVAETVLVGLFSSDMTTYGVVLGLSGLLLYLASFVEREPMIHVVSNILLAAGLFTVFDDQFVTTEWAPAATGVVLTIIWYGLSLYFRRPEANTKHDQDRSIVMSISAIGILAVAAYLSMFSAEETVVAGALLGCVTAVLIAYEGMVRKLFVAYEIAIYVTTFSLQRLIAEVYPDANWLVYTHWWALSIAISAALYHSRTKNSSVTQVRVILALCALSIPTGLAAIGFDATGGYRLLFLFEHVALAVAGLAFNKKLLVQWGAIGVGLSVLYMLQGYTYLLLALIALGLIGLAIWRLTVSTKDKS